MNKEMAEVLVRVGPEAPMGKLMRRYWVPVLSSWEIPEPDCPQVRVKILGERLIAFRDTDGRAGLIDEFCAHRGVSLFYGRNEENGLRCSYHGWKFDREGKCVELPSVPALASKMSITAYPCIERGGLVWAYMGPPGKEPPPPGLEWCGLPDSHKYVSKRLQECSWLQAMEGGIDTTHASWVHRYELEKDPMHQKALANKYIKADRNAVFDVEDMPHGLSIYGRRNGEPDSFYWRVTQYIFPWYTLIPPFGPHPLGGHIWVPIDDENCWAWSINFYPDKPLSHEERSELEDGKGIHVRYEKGSFRPAANKDNDYLVDRVAQKEKRSFSGVEGFSVQDSSLQESMGPIQDHSREHLVSTDKPIAMARRMLFNAALNLSQGIEPPALDDGVQRVRAASVLLDKSASVTEWAKDVLYDELGQPVYSL
jgi:nitrite reductase/ring-hydroxylating ferredoxin subunit